ncbi:MAG: hypothetical protein QNK04_32830 [Myxococcota bacterium]|nr:hypothetical protein [Myxococcota bacterium]
MDSASRDTQTRPCGRVAGWSRLVALLAALASAPGVGLATDPEGDPGEAPSGPVVEEEKAEETPATTPAPAAPPRDRAARRPTRTFNPSEKIDADSVISFPSDI